ncbi:putative transferase [Helianthus annuus]|nr:putative transferase [Helianthus annuus]KAJ0543410.1 putative transferase [Helianthus annuus]KAJ0708468.1 putative transferase [Helianthus annuus]
MFDLSKNSKFQRFKNQDDFGKEAILNRLTQSWTLDPYLLGLQQPKEELLYQQVSYGNYEVIKKLRSEGAGLEAQELKNKMQSSGMPWSGDEGQQRWEQAWIAIKKVWASKWNEITYFSTRKVKLDHELLCMVVLVQEIINDDYAFVIYTTNPSSGDPSEIYAEVVKGLGETLVGAYPGRALSFIAKKDKLDSPKVLGYPSKPIGLFHKKIHYFPICIQW